MRGSIDSTVLEAKTTRRASRGVAGGMGGYSFLNRRMFIKVLRASRTFPEDFCYYVMTLLWVIILVLWALYVADYC